MTDQPVSDEPIIVAQETTTDKGVDFTKTAAYTPRLDGTFDPFKEQDMRMAREVARVLLDNYPGYPWKVISEIRQGYVAFQLPELMGPTLHAFIRLADMGNMSDVLIKETAGNMLERINLPRGKCDMVAYHLAKAEMSKFDFADVGKKRRHA